MNTVNIIFGTVLLASSIGFIIKSLKSTNWFSSIIFFMLAGILGLFSIGAFVQDDSGQSQSTVQQQGTELKNPKNSILSNITLDPKIYDVPTLQANLIEKEKFYKVDSSNKCNGHKLFSIHAGK